MWSEIHVEHFSIFLDDIRLHGFVGHFSEGHLLPHTHSVQLFTHLHFNIDHNGQKVINNNLYMLYKKRFDSLKCVLRYTTE